MRVGITRAQNWIIEGMGLELSFTARVENMLVIGDKIKCMAKVCYTTLTKRLPMMVSGKMINFRAMEYCITKKLVYWKHHLIIEILLMLKNIGWNTKAIFIKTISRGKGNYIYQMVKY